MNDQPPAQQPPASPPQLTVSPLPQADQQPGVAGQAPLIPEMPVEAADNDVMEAEWVIKTKQVVAETKQDPYRQVQAINRIKADYMKKRYDRDIKLAED